MANPAKTAAEIKEEQERLLIERINILYDKVWRSGAIGYGSDDFKAGLSWRMHRDMYARIMTSENLFQRLVGYSLYEAVKSPSGAPSIMGIPIERDRDLPVETIILRWEAKSDG